MYEIPSASSSDHGLEGFSIAVRGTRVGRVGAVNSAGGGPVLVVDMGSDYRALPATTIEQIDTVNRAITLTTDGEAALEAAPPVEPDVQRIDTPRLLRHIPREFDRFLVEGERVATRPSYLWYVGAPLLLLGAVGLFAVPVVAVEAEASRTLLALSFAAPLSVLLAGIGAIWVAMSRDSPTQLSVRDRIADMFSVALAISPRTRRRG